MAKIIGNTTATPNPRPDWNQSDDTKADYIKNKPSKLSEFENDIGFTTGGSASSSLKAEIKDNVLYITQTQPTGDGYTIVSAETGKITIYADKWMPMDNSTEVYYQVTDVEDATITHNSKVDLQPSPTQLIDFYNNGITLTTVNADGVIAVYAMGEKPTKDYTIQSIITEINKEDEVASNE